MHFLNNSAPSCQLILQNKMSFQCALNTADVFIHINTNPDISGITWHFCDTCQVMSREALYNMQRQKNAMHVCISIFELLGVRRGSVISKSINNRHYWTPKQNKTNANTFYFKLQVCEPISALSDLHMLEKNNMKIHNCCGVKCI